VAGGTGTDYATIKYSEAGVPLWTNRYHGYTGPLMMSDDIARAIAVDGSNAVIVTGSSWGGGGNADYATIKYSSAGVPLWTNRYNGLGNGGDGAAAVAVDGSNNVIVTGTSFGSGSSYGYATIKYSGAGVPLWTNRYNGYNGPRYGLEFANAMAVDGNGDVIVTRYSTVTGSLCEYATVKYSSAGAPLWTNRCGGSAGNLLDKPCAVVVDGGNNVIATFSSGSTNSATVKYSSSGLPLWTNSYLSGRVGSATAVGVDGGNNVIVTGYSCNGTNDDCATIKYSSAGLPL
jgi:hypothetical protein